MRKRIFINMNVLVVLVLILTIVCCSVIQYNQNLEQMKKEVHYEVDYIENAVEISGMDYLETISRDNEDSRVSLIDVDGTVLYDSTEDVQTMKNHGNREEVQEAIATGNGQAMRHSASLDVETYYYAHRLSNGTILRVASTTDSVIQTIWNSLPITIGITLLALGLSFLGSRLLTKVLLKPIVTLDLENPKQCPYEEIYPLLERIEQQKVQIIEEAERAQKSRRDFVANVSHELKTPLMTISGYAEIIKNNIARPEDIPNFSGRIYSEANRLSTLVQDIIKLSELDEEDMVRAHSVVDMRVLTENILEYLEPEIDKKRIRLMIEGEGFIVYGIKNILEEMVYNICENAIRYNQQGGFIKVKFMSDEQNNTLTVEDSGIGIGPEEQERIFERFYRVDKSRSRESGGTGLGLSIVKHGAILHHAQVRVESQLGEGTKMYIDFPKENYMLTEK